MSEFSLSDTLRSLASKLDGLQEVLNGSNGPVGMPLPQSIPVWPSYGSLNTTVPVTNQPGNAVILQKLESLSNQVEELRRNVSVLRNQPPAVASILPLNPMHGIEVVPKREVVLSEANPLSVADRLLLNKDAKKALEAEEMGASRVDEYPLGEDAEEEAEEVEEAEEEVEAEAEEEVEEEVEEAEAEAEEESEELDEFEYKGNTYYRDSSNNVFMMGEDDELDTDPIGTWNPEKNRIVMKAASKPAA